MGKDKKTQCNCIHWTKAQRKEYRKSQIHPSNNELLVHFIFSVKLFDDFMRTFGITIRDHFDIKDKNLLRKYELALMLQRKYWGCTEELRLDKVINAALVQPELSSSCIKELTDDKIQFEHIYCAHKADRSNDRNNNREKENISPHQVDIDDLYGTLIHSDYRKWVTAVTFKDQLPLIIQFDVPKLDQLVHDVYKILNQKPILDSLCTNILRRDSAKVNNSKQVVIDLDPDYLFDFRKE